jgi:hypothetical protein
MSEYPNDLIANAGDSQMNLSWVAVDGAIRYNLKRSITAGGPYIIIATNIDGTSYTDNTVTNKPPITIATAVDSSSIESANSNEASVTPQAPNGYGLLRITMNGSSEREYQ